MFLRKLVLIILLTRCCSIFSQAETLSYSHFISVNYGTSAYLTDMAMPSGILGNTYSLHYAYMHSPQEKIFDLFYCTFNGNYSLFTDNNFVIGEQTFTYEHWAFNTDISWMWTLLNQRKLKHYIGGDLGINGYYFIPDERFAYYSYYPLAYGEWGINAGFTDIIEWEINNISFQNTISIPLIIAGYFPIHIVSTEVADKYFYLQPNTIAWIGNYRLISNHLKAVIPFGKIGFALSYLFQYQHSNVHQNKERYLQHSLGLGIQF